MLRFRPTQSLLFTALALTLATSASAQRPTNVPALSSRTGSAYTLYLNFGGFNFRGNWGGNGSGTRAYATYGNATGSFSASQQAEIREIWARTAEKYTAFGINVTTVDPASAGLTDSQRQLFYDQTARVQHSIVTPTDSANNSTSGGVSFLGLLQNSYNNSFDNGANGGAGRGYHTNFINTPANPTYDRGFMVKSTAETIAHENGHALTLDHQSDYYSNGSVEEYSDNFGQAGYGFTPNSPNGTFAPVMGFSDFAQRGLWRSGKSQGQGGNIQNDVRGILSNSGIGGLYEDGIGNSFETATQLALNGSSVDSSRAKGVVVPRSATDPNPRNATDYQGGYYAFRASGAVTLRATNGSSFLQSGVADPGMTLRNVLRIYNSSFALVATGTEDSATRWSEFSGSLTSGTYYAFVTSTGGFTSSVDSTANYYNMGSYFLSGTGFAAPVPEPASMLALAAGGAYLLRRRRKSV